MHSISVLLIMLHNINEGGQSLYKEFIDATLHQSSESILPGSGSPIVLAPSSGHHEPYKKPVTPTTPSIGMNTESSSPPSLLNTLLKHTVSLQLSCPLKAWNHGKWNGLHTNDSGVFIIDLFNNHQEVDPGSLASVVASKMIEYDIVCVLVHTRSKWICRFIPRGCTIGVCPSAEAATTFLQCLLGDR